MAKRTASQSLTLSLMPKEGKTTYTWIRYADSATGEGMSNDPTGKKYIGIATNKLVSTESTDPGDYMWSLIKGEDGVPGSDGDSKYVWIAYSDHSNGVPMYQQPRASTMYIGIAANKDTAEESTNPADYTWSKFKGDQGVPGINGQDAKYVYLFSSYQVNPGCEISVNGGENLIPDKSSSTKWGHRGFNVMTLDRTTLAMLEYRWFDTYSDRTGENVMENMAAYLDSLDDSVLLCIATYDWVDWLDNIIKSLQTFGLGTLPHTERGYYPFVFVGYKGIPEGYAKYALHSGPSSSSNKAEMSVYIANGSIAFSPAGTAGIGVEDVVNYYAVSSSPTTAPTSGWSTTPPQMTETNRYLWNYEVTTFTDGSTQETTKSLIGVHGASGANGVGIESITEYFLASSEASGVTTATSGWTTEVQDTTNEKPYLWNYEIVRYTDNTTYTSKPRIIGTKGETVIGKDGYTLEVDRTNYAIPCEADGTPLDSELNNGQLKNAVFTFEAFYGGKQLTLSYNTTLTKSNNLISSESSVVTVAQKENNNFNFVTLSLGRFIRPNTTYTLSVGSSQMTAGTSTQFTFYLYDNNTSVNYGGGNCKVSTSRQVITFTTNDKPTGNDGVLLVYAGTSGATSGKGIKITNIQLEEGNSATSWAAGSKGKGSWTFGTPVASVWRTISGSSCGINSVSADTGYCDINFNLEGEITLTKRLSFVKQKKGEQGIDGGSSYKLITGVTTLDSMHGEDYLGYWYAGGGNGLGGRPAGVDAFSLQVLRTAAGYYTQVLYPSNELTNTMWIRTWNASTGWTEWVEKGKEGQSARYIYLRGTAHSSQHFDGVTTATTPALVRTSGGETNLSISSRGLTVITLDRHELTVVTRQTFDTLTESATRNQQMADLLNSLDDSVFLCIVSFDAFYLNSAHGGDVVIEALKAFGLGTVDRARLNYRCPFAFLGQKGLQSGYAYMAEGGDSINYPDSHDVEISAYVAEGAIAYAPEGRKGSMIRMRGEWKVGQTYVNQQDYADVVLYDGSYYICIAESGAVSSDTNPKTDTTNWAPFNEFENIATSVLLANKGYINVLGAGKAFIGQSETANGWELTQGHIKHTGTNLELTSDGKLKIPDYGALTIGGGGVKVAAGNLIKDSGRFISTTEYFLTGYSVYTELVVGQKYTFVAKGSDASNTGIGLWDNRGQNRQGNAKFDENGLAIIYFTYSKSSSATTSSISMYHYNDPGTQCTVEWAMLFEGHSLPPTSWEPAPQEQDTGVGSNFITYSETNEDNKAQWWNVSGGTTTYYSDGVLPHYYYVYPGVAGAGLCTPPLYGALVSGKYYTLSFYGYGSTAFTIDKVVLMGTENGNIAVPGTINVPTGSASNYPRTTFTFRAPQNATQCSGILLGVNAATTVGINIANVKLELGSIATAWTPEFYSDMQAYKTYVGSEFAVRDTHISSKVSQSEYNALEQRVGTAESNITQNADAITQQVSEYNQFKGSVNEQISEINQTATSISQTVSSNYTQLASEIKKAAPYTEVTLDASALDQNTWYPVTIGLYTNRPTTIQVYWALNGSPLPSWGTHRSGYSVFAVWRSNGSGWGSQAINRTILEYSQSFVQNDVTVAGGISQLSWTSEEYIFVRGGGKYTFRTEGGSGTPVLHSTTYTSANDQTISPTTTAPARPVPNVKSALQAAQYAQDAAESAQAEAEAASARLDKWAEDGVITPMEKDGLKDELARIKSDKDEITQGYSKYGIGTPTSYNNAYTAYYNQLDTLTASSTWGDTIDIPSSFRSNQTAYYTQRTNALNAIADAAKGYVEDNYDKSQLMASMAAGKMLSQNSDPTFKKGTNGITRYNNSGNSTVTVSRITLSGVPNDTGYAIQIVNNGGTSSPNRGGFTFETQSKANFTTVVRFIAKIPTGYTINHHSNTHGTNPKEIWLTSQAGTGDWKEYVFYCKCGASGTFSTYNFFALSGTPNAVTWYLAYSTVFDVSSAGVSNLDITNLQSEVDSAAQAAQNATTVINNMISDNILSPIEKQQTKLEWDAIVSEYSKYWSLSGSLIGDSSVSSARENYQDIYNALSAYISPLLNSLTTNSSINGTTFRTNFVNYYAARTTLLNAITNCAGGILDTRNDNQSPSWYLTNFPKKVVREFKTTAAIGLTTAFPGIITETYCLLETYVQWGDTSGGYPRQTAISQGRLFSRQGTSATAWTAWRDSTTTLEVESAIDQSATNIMLRVDSKLVNLFKDGSFENDVNTVGNTDATLGKSNVSFPSWHDIYEPYDERASGKYRNIMPFGSRVMAVRNWTTGGQNRVILGQHVPIEPLKKYTIIVWRHDGGTRLAEDGYRWLNVRTPATSPTQMEVHISTSQPSWEYGWHQEVYVTEAAPSWAQSMQVFFGTKNDTNTRDKNAWTLFDGVMVIEGDLTQNGGKYIPESYFGDNQTDMSESLYRTGINVASGEVTVNADRFRITDSTGVPKLLFDSDSGLLRTELIDTDALKVKNIEAGTGTIDFLSAPENVTGGLGVYIGRGAFEEVIASSNSVGTARSGNVNLTFQHATGAVGAVNSGMQENTLYTIQGKQTCSIYISGSIRTTLNAYGQLRDSNDAHILSDELGMADVAVSIWIKRGTIYEKLIGSTGVHAPTFKVDVQGKPYDLKETVSKSTTINLAETLLIEAGTSVSIVARYSYRLDRKQDTNTARATLYIPSPTSLNVSVNTRVVALCADGMLMQSSTSNAMHLIPGTYSDQAKGFRFESDNIIQFAAPLAPTRRSQKDVTTPNSGLGGDSSDITYWAGYDLINYTGATSSYFYLPDVTIAAIINHFRLYTKNSIIIRPAGSGLSGLGANKEEYRTQVNHLYTLDYLSDDTWCIS